MSHGNKHQKEKYSRRKRRANGESVWQRAVGVGLAEKETLEQMPEWSEEVSHTSIWGKNFPGKQKRKCTPCVWETARKEAIVVGGRWTREKMMGSILESNQVKAWGPWEGLWIVFSELWEAAGRFTGGQYCDLTYILWQVTLAAVWKRDSRGWVWK